MAQRGKGRENMSPGEMETPSLSVDLSPNLCHECVGETLSQELV
jgi:hypothetical protein